MADGVTGIQQTVLEVISVREYSVSLRRMAHVFLNSKVGNPHVEVQRCAHRHRRQIGRAVAAGAYLIQAREIGDSAQVSNAACMYDRRAYVVDELVLDQILAVPDGVEDLTDR